MALFAPYKILSTQLNSLPIVEGQIIVTTDTQEIYFDITDTIRKKLYADNVKSLTIDGNTLVFTCETATSGIVPTEWQSNSTYVSKTQPENMNSGDIWLVLENKI